MSQIDQTSNLVKRVPNPTGKGGFQERPEDINRNGTWDPRLTFNHQYKRFLRMTVEEFTAWGKETDDTNRTNVEIIAWIAVGKARTDLKERQELANRTEGMPKQSLEIDQTDARMKDEISELKKIIIDISHDGKAKDNSQETTSPVQNQ